MRDVPVALQAHLDGGVCTTAFLVRIEPVTAGYSAFGITSLDRDVVYDDGDGEITYLSAIGMVPSAIASASDMSVDNSTAEHLIPEFDIPFSDAELTAGILDFAWYSRYLVNYEDLTMGHVVVEHGQCGEMRNLQGMTFTSEMTSLSKLLKQSIVEKDSLTCRATFGSKPIGTPDADIVERFPCGKDYTWVDGEVLTVGAESNRTFTASISGATGTYTPGMVKWVEGANAGRQSEVEEFTAGATVDLAFETMFPIQVGDTFQIRRDCTKWVEGDNGCKDHFGEPEWKLHYRGEPYIPVADADQINTPGATVGAGLGGSTT
ncbi:DUF2163 domain-containing protein [Variovorax sp. RT4R15]|uniref:DUF2163 domain-containing protein n=1 Tax=Variovorax sp. RT4R15 TaxID=3443737 RepID=UPI003F47646E